MLKKVLVAMSGGVDSTYAAIILKEQGYELIGVTFKIDDSESSYSSIDDAKSICKILNIEHVTVDYTDIFKENVIDYFIDSYRNGITPNPCVICNKMIKFTALNELRKELNCDFVATGHYVRIQEIDGQVCIKKAVNLKKDQSYFLNQVPFEILPFYLFPLGAVNSKEEVREFLKSRNIEIANKKESQEICFVKEDKLSEYLNEYIPQKMGNIVDEGNNILGKHKGVFNYTIGQRKGLGVSSIKPLYVLKTDINSNVILLGDEKKLLNEKVTITDVNVFNREFLKNINELYGKVRYRSELGKIKSIKFRDEFIDIEFLNEQKSITPGQYAVIYYNDYLVLGGKII